MRNPTSFFALFLLACSSSNPSNSPDASGPDGSTTDAAAESGMDATADTAGDDASEGGCPDAGAPLTTNMLLLSSGNFTMSGMTQTNLLFKNFIASAGQQCFVTKQTIGDAGTGTCYVQDCRPGDAGGSAMGLNAGDITLKTSATTVTSISPNSGDNHYLAGIANTPWNPGDMLHFSAAGGCDVPAFDVPLTGPSTVVVTSPGADGGVTIDHTMDFTVTWTPSDAGSGGVTIVLEQPTTMTDPSASDLRVACEVPGADGTATIPAAIVGLFTTGAGSPVSFVVGGNATADVTPGGYSMHVWLVNSTSFQATVQ